MFRASLSARCFLGPETELGIKFKSLGVNTVNQLAMGKMHDPMLLKTTWGLVAMEAKNHLWLDELHFSPASAKACMSSFKLTTSPKITLSNLFFIKEGFKSHLPTIFESLNPKTRHLKIEECGLDDNDARIIARNLKDVDLDTLDLNSNYIGLRGAEVLRDSVDETSKIRRIILDNNMLCDEDALQIKSNPIFSVKVTSRWAT